MPAPAGPTIRSSGTVHIVTGERGSGKSTLCGRVVREARARGLAVAGILTEESAAGGRVMTDLSSGETRPFGDRTAGRQESAGAVASAAAVAPASAVAPAGRKESAGPAASAGGNSSDPLTPGWNYDAGVFEWGNEVLRRATPCDLLVVDELGPIEILGGRGWVAAFDVLSEADFAMALVVCRPGLLQHLEERLGFARGEIYEVTRDSRDGLSGTIAERLLDTAR